LCIFYIITMTRVLHSQFDRNDGYNLGRSRFLFWVWYPFKIIFFLSSIPWPRFLKSSILRLFGGRVGRGVYWKPRVNIHIPWRIEIGDHALVGEEVIILNFEDVRIGTQACISQRAFICTGNHDFTDVRMRYRNRPISIGDGAWIGAQVFVAPGVVIGEECVVTAGSIVVKSLPNGMICSGNPCVALKHRWK
jgi:putative colanic acid biosynthesis acetyltransferase WcaF